MPLNNYGAQVGPTVYGQNMGQNHQGSMPPVQNPHPHHPHMPQNMVQNQGSALAKPHQQKPTPADIYRQQHGVSVTGNFVPPPILKFEGVMESKGILNEIQNAGFSSPTPIQAQFWPIAMNGRDVVAIAKAGSGRTLGYLMVAFRHLRDLQPNPERPNHFVLATTKDLAIQIQNEAIKFGQSSMVTCNCLDGDASNVDLHPNIVVATPRRLVEILRSEGISTKQVAYLVLDDTDLMLQMGFELDIREIAKEIESRQQKKKDKIVNPLKEDKTEQKKKKNLILVVMCKE